MRSTGQVYALKTLNKWEMLKRAEVGLYGHNIFDNLKEASGTITYYMDCHRISVLNLQLIWKYDHCTFVDIILAGWEFFNKSQQFRSKCIVIRCIALSKLNNYVLSYLASLYHVSQHGFPSYFNLMFENFSSIMM